MLVKLTDVTLQQIGDVMLLPLYHVLPVTSQAGEYLKCETLEIDLSR